MTSLIFASPLDMTIIDGQNLTQLNSTGHVTLTAKRDRKGKKSKSL